jgi:hypothetical protein
MQSIEPSIPGNPLASFIAKRLDVSSAFGGSQVVFPEHFHNGYCKAFHTLSCLTLTHCQVVINKIGWNAVCHHTQGGGHFLVSAMPNLAARIPPLLKKLILLRHLLANMVEQVDTHPKTATEVAFGES